MCRRNEDANCFTSLNDRLLFELDTASDPVWHCLSSQYRWIKKIMTESYDEQVILVEELRKSDDVVQSQNMTATGRTVLFRQILSAIKSGEFETTFSKEPEVRVWMAILSGVKTLSELLLRLLPDFWKLATAFMEGKIQKVKEEQIRLPFCLLGGFFGTLTSLTKNRFMFRVADRFKNEEQEHRSIPSEHHSATRWSRISFSCMPVR